MCLASLAYSDREPIAVAGSPADSVSPPDSTRLCAILLHRVLDRMTRSPMRGPGARSGASNFNPLLSGAERTSSRMFGSRNAQHPQHVFCQMLIDLSITGNGLGNFRGGVLVPIGLSAVADEHTPNSFKLSDEILALHRSVSSASLRTPGISPLVRSRCRSRRWASKSSRDDPWVQ